MTSAEPLRVLVVDDSAFARKVLREVLSAASDIDVVGVARDGLEALELVQALDPDVITLDLVMPNLDGLGVLRVLPRESVGRVVVVSVSDAESALGVDALTAGAFDVVHKPTALATQRLYELGAELVQKVRAAGQRRRGRVPAEAPTAPKLAPDSTTKPRLLAVAASTGGPQALTRLLARLPRDFPIPVVIALHIPAGYTRPLSERLTRTGPLTVLEAADPMALVPGQVALAAGGTHLQIATRNGELWGIPTHDSQRQLYTPSADLLFRSAAAATDGRVLGVVLTGMGDDGLVGARAIHEAGGQVVTEAERSCVVYGMPRCVREAGLSSAEATLDELPGVVIKMVGS